MDYAGEGDLFTYLQRKGLLTERAAQLYCGSLVLALRYLHSRYIAHRDLKPENILIRVDGQILLSDLGLSKDRFDQTGRSFTLVGTSEYIAPEMLRGEGHDTQVDWWQLGLVTHEMLTGKHPFYSESTAKMHQKIIYNAPVLDSSLSPAAKSFIQGLLIKDPQKRLGIDAANGDIEKHEFFRGLNWQQLFEKKIEPDYKPVLMVWP